MAPRVEAEQRLAQLEVLRVGLAGLFAKQMPKEAKDTIKRWEREAAGPGRRQKPIRATAKDLAQLGIPVNPKRKGEH